MTQTHTPGGFDDETLMAYADGLLSSVRATEIETAAASDASLRKRIDVFVETRRRLAAAFGAADPTPMPDGFEARIRALAAPASARRETEAVVDLAAARAGRAQESVRKGAPWFVVPLAASLALVAGGLLGRLTAVPVQGNPVSPLATLASADVSVALSSVPAGERIKLTGGDQFQVVSTFRDGAGSLCREFEIDTATGAATVAVACRADAVWAVQFAAASATGTDGYAPASSMEALDAWLAATGAGAPLDAAAEKTALQQRP